MDFSQELAHWLEGITGSSPEIATHPSGHSVVSCDGRKILCISVSSNKSFDLDSGIIHVWEDHWRTRLETVEGRLLSAFGQAERIHGRETQVVKLTQPEANEFMITNHLLPPVKGKHKYGLVLKGELVTAAVFSKKCPVDRNGKQFQSVVMMRFCHANGKSVNGGLTKLVAHIFKEEQPDDIMTYVDREWSQSGAFEKVGFIHEVYTEATPFWIHPENFDRVYTPGIKSDEQMQKAGYLRFTNHGSEKLIQMRQ